MVNLKIENKLRFFISRRELRKYEHKGSNSFCLCSSPRRESPKSAPNGSFDPPFDFISLGKCACGFKTLAVTGLIEI